MYPGLLRETKLNMSEQTPIKVMIVDDHPIVRDGIVNLSLIYDDIELVGKASGGL